MSFAAIETATNAACMGALFNATATWNGTSVSVIFDRQYDDPLGMSSSRPSALALSSAVAGATVGQSFVVNSVTYAIVAIEPDGTGLTRLILEKA